jgi:hypothetical protein
LARSTDRIKASYDGVGRGANSALEWLSDVDVVGNPLRWRQCIEGELTVAGDKLAVLPRLQALVT